jgi:uncharacterized repeat protein (TIGR03803 family)
MRKIYTTTLLLALATTINAQIAFFGGTSNNSGAVDYNYGVLYRFVPSTNEYTALANCTAAVGNKITGLTKVGDMLYGTTETEGLNGDGTVISFDPATNTLTKLADFDSLNGKAPVDDLVLANDGLLYGVTQFGGTTNSGVLFSFDPSTNTITNLVNFQPGPFVNPRAGMILGSNGNLYGVVSFYDGGLFEYDIDQSAFQYIYSYPSGLEGRVPSGRLIEVQDSVFYGSNRYGGSGDSGTLFKFDYRTGTYTVLKHFQGGLDGTEPLNAFVNVDNVLYGFVYRGGISDLGFFFKYDLTEEQYTKIIDLDYSNGAYPDNRPVLGSDNSIYCPTKSGGNQGRGNMTKYVPTTNAFTSLFDFQTGTGSYPINGLVELCITPAPTGSATVTLCEGGTIDDLDATGTNVKWYASPTSTTQLTANTAVTNATTYYAGQTIECPSKERLPVTVSIQTPPDTDITVSNQTLTVDEPNANYQWINCTTNSNISGANAQSYTATANGQYKVRVTLGPCAVTSDCELVGGLAIDDLNMSQVVVYPNPVANLLTIEMEKSFATLDILDLAGKLILSKTINSQRAVIDLSNWVAGGYTLRLTDMEGKLGHKMIMKK